MKRRATSIVTWCVAVFAIAGFTWLTRTRGHHQDVAMFRGWFLSLAAAPRRVYLDRAADVNYGAVGLLVSTVAGWLLPSNASAAQFHATHKGLLALWTLGAAWCVYALRVRLDPSGVTRRERGVLEARGAALALGFVAWPCIAVGALYFGQIDVVALVFVLLAFLAGHEALTRAPGRARRSSLARFGAFTALAILTKPLVLFSLPALGLLALAVFADTDAREGRDAVVCDVGTIVGATITLLVLPDLFFDTPRENLCHVWHVYRWAGPPHGEMIGNGAGLWAFLGWAPDASSRDALAFGLSPRTLGLACFLAALAWHTIEFARDVRRDRSPSAIAAHALRHAGLLQLAMSLFLAGTHERYAFLAWAPLLVALVTYPHALDRHRLALAAVLLAGTFQGLFVASTIEWNAFDHAPLFRSTRVAAALTFVAWATAVVARNRALSRSCA